MENVVEEVVRSRAMDRRLRLRRQEARLRVKLLSDVALLDEHHASAAPRLLAPGLRRPVASAAEVASLRCDLEAMRGQLNAFAVLLAKGAVAASDASAHAFDDATVDVVAAREALTPAGVAATQGSVTASGTSSPAVGVAAESVVTVLDVVMDSVGLWGTVGVDGGEAAEALDATSRDGDDGVDGTVGVDGAMAAEP